MVILTTVRTVYLIWKWAHSGCDRSTGDAYSSIATDPTFGVSRGPSKSDFYCGLFHYLNWTLILIADFSVYLTRCTDFNNGLFCLPNLDTLILTTDFYVWYGVHGGCDRSAGRCLLLHGTWSHLWYIQRSVYVHSLICISYRIYEIDYCSLFLSFHLKECVYMW
jgi:hypothetical protein